VPKFEPGAKLFARETPLSRAVEQLTRKQWELSRQLDAHFGINGDRPDPGGPVPVSERVEEVPRDQAPGLPDEPAPGAEDDWRTPPRTNRPPGSFVANEEPLPHLLHPDTPWEELTPRARSAIDARNRDTMAEIRERLEAIRSGEQLRE